MRIPEICQTVDRFDALKREFSFWVDRHNGEDHLQLNFGRRKVGVNDFDGKPAIEKGASLVYTLSRTGGVVSTVLYPASSELGRVEQDHIFLRIGSYSGFQLLSKLRSDLEDLVAYTFVSSIEAVPSVRDRIRFWWLLRTHPQSVDGKFVRPLRATTLMISASKFTAAYLVAALLRPTVIVVAYLLFVYLGFANLVQSPMGIIAR
ncbi:hypothetical protein Rpal_4355 [Rhodopseudomonas palustris TIE-1]|nr:hypothetical protein Rpal_4355 [Rhodopseudomonas palustris TIE-1]